MSSKNGTPRTLLTFLTIMVQTTVRLSSDVMVLKTDVCDDFISDTVVLSSLYTS